MGSSCGVWAQRPQGMWHLSSLTRDWTRIPCIGRWTRNNRTTKTTLMRSYLYKSHNLASDWLIISAWAIASVCVCVCVCARVCAHTGVKSLQSCLTRCDPMDCSPPGSSVHGTLQTRLLEWVAMSFSRGSSRPRDQTCISYVSCVGRQVLYHQRHLGSLPLSLSSLQIVPHTSF